MAAPRTSALPRVGHVVAGDVFGGAERQVLTLCKAAPGRYSPILLPTLPGPLTAEASAAGIDVRPLYLVSASLPSCAHRLHDLARSLDLDVLHTHGYRAAAIVALAGLHGRPVVRTVHGAPEAFRSPRLAINELVGRLSDRWSAATRVFVSDDLKDRLGAGPSARVIHNGVEIPSTTPPRPEGFAPGRAHFVAVGRLEPVKALEVAIEAMSQGDLAARAILHVVGDGPERASLEARVAALGLGSAVFFHGFRRDALAFIAHADALVLSSRHEGVPYVLLEALALGTPAVSTRVGGIPEVVRDGVEGLLVPPADPDALGAALSRLLNEPALAARMIGAGRDRITAAFSADIMAARYADLYREVIDRRHGR